MKPHLSPIKAAGQVKRADEAAKKLNTRIAFGLRPWDEEIDEMDLTHEHRCQQCDKLLKADCDCLTTNRMEWCSSTCRAAFDFKAP